MFVCLCTWCRLGVSFDVDTIFAYKPAVFANNSKLLARSHILKRVSGTLSQNQSKIEINADYDPQNSHNVNINVLQ